MLAGMKVVGAAALLRIDVKITRNNTKNDAKKQ
jgi:hypothetical protein